MTYAEAVVQSCPHLGHSDERKSAAIAAQGGALPVGGMTHDFHSARRLLRDPDARQAGFLADLVTRFSVTRAPILYLSGEAHRRQRAATARFFAPRVVTSGYRALMVRTSDALVAQLIAAGRADLDTLALDLAVTVAAEIVGLTDSNRAGMARRLEALVSGMDLNPGRFGKLLGFLRGQVRAMLLLHRDVKPAIRSRRRARRDDVISQLLEQGYTDSQILTECLTYGAAGMVTTREFITMAGWHLIERQDLRNRFLATDEAGRIAMLEEILRLEPVVGLLYRRVAAANGVSEVIGIDIRSCNADEAVAGPCPHRLDPYRDAIPKVGRGGLAFGDGEHRCPGAQVALQESAIFLDRLLRVPGLVLARDPDIGWNPLIAGYELRSATLTVGVPA